MGCEQSAQRKTSDGDGATDANGLPNVPAGSWYGSPYDMHNPAVTVYHESHKGEILFNTEIFPTADGDLAALPGGVPRVRQERFCLGVDNMYGMAYLHATPLFTEYTWRSRVAHDPPQGKFEKPFYDTLVGIKVSVDGVAIPDSAPTAESLPQCTATLKSHEAMNWTAIPIVLLPDPLHSIVRHSSAYYGLMQSFAMRALTLRPTGDVHRVDVEVCYGCKNERDFCTPFIAQGSFEMVVLDDAMGAVRGVLDAARRGLASEAAAARQIPLAMQEQNHGPCPSCGDAMRYACSTCTAPVCGGPACSSVARRGGYPQACSVHMAVN